MSDSKMSYATLIAYAAGELSGDDAARVEDHLSADAAAAETVARYRQTQGLVQADDGADPPPETVTRAKAIYVAPDAAAPRSGLIEQIDRFVARLIFDSRAQPAPVGLRGPVSGFQLAYELPDARLDLEAEIADDTADARQWRLVGQISAPQLKPTKVALHASGDDRQIQSAETDEHGVFVLRTGAGTYDLHIGLPQRVAVVADIRIP